MDVYIRQGKKVELIDINPWAEQTDPLLFSWDQLLSFRDFSFLRIESQFQVQNYSFPQYSTSRLPKDIIDVSNGVLIEEFADKFQTLLNND